MKLFSIQEVANLLGVSTKTLRRWEEKGILLSQRTPGNQRRYTQDHIDNFRRQSGTFVESTVEEIPFKSPTELISSVPHQKPLDVTGHSQYWTEELVKSILVFKKLAVSAVFVMLFVAVVAVAVAALKSANLLNIASLPKVLSIVGINKNKPQPPELSEVLRTGGKAVLGAGTSASNLIFGVNVQSEFADSAQFLDTIKVAGVATLSGGVITENQDVNAGTGKLTASNVLYGAIGGTGITVGPGQTPTISSTAVLSLTAGSGISVGTGTKPTISNTGVLSLGGSTGDLTLKAGTGISVSGLTITNSDTGTSQNIFKTIAVTGSTSFAASGNTDTLTFEAGTGITLATNTSSKKVTITGAGGWQENNGALSPSNITDDLLLGGISTSTAKFAFINVVGSGTPTASISAASTGLVLSADGSIQNIRNATLTLGGTTTGNILLSPLNGGAGANVTIQGTTTLGDSGGIAYTWPAGPTGGQSSGFALTTNGSGSLSWQDLGSSVSNFWRQASGAVYTANSTVDFLIGTSTGVSSSAKFAVLNINSGTPTASVSAGTNGGTYLTATGTLQTTVNQPLTIGGNTTGDITLSPLNGSGTVTNTGNLNLLNGKEYQIAGSSVLTSSTLGSGVLTSSLTSVGTIGTGVWQGTAVGVLYGGTGQTTYTDGQLLIGNTTGNTLTKATLTAGTGISITNGSGSITIANSQGSIDAFWNQSSGLLFPNNSTVDFALGGTASSSAKFAVLNINSGTPTASVSAGTAGGSYLNAAGTLATTAKQTLTLGDANTGNIILSNLTYANAGLTVPSGQSLTFTGITGNNRALYADTTTGVTTGVTATSTSLQCLMSGAAAPSWGNCPGSGSGGSKWTELNGLLYPNNLTVDLLVGGTSTTAAKFAVLNINSGTPTASVSANSGNIATYLTGDGTLATTNRQTLTIGNSATYDTTGNVLINPNGTGNVGIGTTGPGTKLDLLGTSGLPGNYNAGMSRIRSASNESLSFGTLGSSPWSAWIQSGDSSIQSLTTYPLALQPSGGNVGIGTTSPTALLDVAGTASVAGAFTIYTTPTIQSTTNQTLTIGGNTTGNITLSPLNGVAGSYVAPNTNGNVDFGTSALAYRNIYGTTYYSGASAGVTAALGCISSTLGIVTGSGACASTSNWDVVNGAITPKLTSTLDFLLGSQASSSAKFAVLNINSGTPTASVSATATGTGLVLGGDGTIQSLKNATLTLGGATTGNIVLSPNNGTGGNVTIQGTTTLNSVKYTWPGADGSSGFALTTSGTGTLSWTNPSGFGTNYWDQTLGTLQPFNKTVDLLLGGTATSSAKFAVLNINSGTPTASVSANSGNNAAFLTGTGNLQTTNAQTLTLGGGSTGDVNLSIGAGNNLRINGTAGSTVASVSCITSTNGIVTGSGACPGGSAGSNWRIASGAISPINDTLDLLIGSNASSSAKFAVLNVAGGTPTASISASSGNNATFLTGLGNLATTNRQTLILGGSTTGLINILNSSGNAFATFDTVGNGLSLGANESINGLLTFFSSGAGETDPTITAEADGDLTVIAATGTVNIGNGTAGDINLDPGAGQLIANLSSTGDFLIQDNAVTFATFSNTGTTTFNFAGTTTTGVSIVADSLTSGTALSITSSNTTSTGSLMSIAGSGLGSQLNISGASGGKAAVVINQTSASQDILTASASGTTKFTISNSGTITTGIWQGTSVKADFGGTGVTTYATGDLLYSGSVNPTALSKLTIGSTNQVLTVSAGIPAWADAGTQAFGLWQTISGSIQPKNQTQDLLLGGTASSSAKFAVLNINSGTPTASVSATAAGTGLVLGGDGTIQSLKNATLTLGGATTGNIVLSPNNGTGGLTTNNANFNLSTGNAYQIAGLSVLNGLTLGDGVTQSSLTKVGTISTGTWIASIIGSQYGGTGADLSAAAQGAVPYFSAAGVMSALAVGTSGQCLTTAGAAANPSWRNCALGDATNWWTANTSQGTLYPINSTLDLLLGGTSTTSAKIGFLNIAGGTPTASISANSGNIAIYITGNGSLATTNRQTLTIGNSATYNTTGNVVINPNGTGRLGVGTASPNNTIQVANLINFDNTAQSTFLGFQTGKNSTGSWNTAVGNNALFNGASGNSGSGNTAMGYQALWANTSGGSSTAVGYQALINNTTGGTNIALGYTPLFNNNVGSNNAAIGYQALYANTSGSTNIGIGYNAGYFDSGTYSSQTGSNNVYIGYNSGPYTLNASLNNSTAIGTFALVNASNSLVLGGTAFYAVNVGIGTATPSAVLDIQGGSMGGNAALIVNQTGVSTNDLFTASSAGATKFTIQNGGTASSAGNFIFDSAATIQTTKNQTLTLGGATTGNITLSPLNGAAGAYVAPNTNGNVDFGTSALTYRNIYGTTYYSGTSVGVTASLGCVSSTLGIVTGSGACPGGAGSNWDVVNGVITPKLTSTLDFLLGSQASASAKFAVLNINSGTPTATLSAGTTGGAYLTAAGTLQTTAKQKLTIGGDTTGQLVLMSRNLTVYKDTNSSTSVFVGPQAGNSNTGVDNTALGLQALFANTSGAENTAVGYLALASSTGNNNTALGSIALNANTTGSNNTALGFQALFWNNTGGSNVGIGYNAGYSNEGAYSNRTGSNNTYIGYNSGPYTLNASFNNTTAIGTFALVNASNSLVLGGTAFYAVNVGIGTATPSAVLDIQGGSMGGNAALIVNQTGASTNNILTASASGATMLVLTNTGSLNLGTGIASVSSTFNLNVMNSSISTAAAQIWNTFPNVGQAQGGCADSFCHTALSLRLGTDPSGGRPGARDRFINFAIGNSEIIGKVRGNGSGGITYDTTGGDYAEWFQKEVPDEQFDYGDVVCLNVKGKVVKCDNNNTKILGAVTDSPGFVGNSGNDDDPSYILVGLLGQIRIKVSLENGSIVGGDMISYSSQAGVGAKAVHKGFALARAIESLEASGSARILAYVNSTWYDPSVYLALDGTLATTSPISTQEAALALGLTGIPSIPNNTPSAGSGSSTSTSSGSFDLAGDQNFIDLKSRVASAESQIADLRSMIINSSTQSAFMQSVLGDTSNVAAASTSADFVNNLSNLDIASATISGNLMVLGRTTLADLGVTGNIVAGLLSVHGLDTTLNNGNGGASINSVGDLNLQNNGLGGINILAGKVTIDTKGNINSQGEITVKKINIDTTPSDGTSAGSVIIKAGTLSVDVNTIALTSSSLIFATPERAVAVGTKKKDKDTFTISLQEPLSEDVKVSWWVVN